MTYIKWLSVTVLVLALAPFAMGADAIEGEVVDSGCFMRNGSHGADHQECAARCLKNGNPAGLLTDDGELFTLAAAASSYESFAAKRIKVSGKQIDRTIFPETVSVWENDAWVEVPLNEYGGPQKPKE